MTKAFLQGKEIICLHINNSTTQSQQCLFGNTSHTLSSVWKYFYFVKYLGFLICFLSKKNKFLHFSSFFLAFAAVLLSGVDKVLL